MDAAAERRLSVAGCKAEKLITKSQSFQEPYVVKVGLGSWKASGAPQPDGNPAYFNPIARWLCKKGYLELQYSGTEYTLGFTQKGRDASKDWKQVPYTVDAFFTPQQSWGDPRTQESRVNWIIPVATNVFGEVTGIAERF